MVNTIEMMAGLDIGKSPWLSVDYQAFAEQVKSIDQRVFSDFGIDGSEKDNRQVARKNSKSMYGGYGDGRNDDQETIDTLRTVSEIVEEQTEKRLASMTKSGDLYQFGDYEYELEDAQSVLREKGIEHFTKDMSTDDAAEFALIAERILNGTATDADHARAGELSPDFVTAGDRQRTIRLGQLADANIDPRVNHLADRHVETNVDTDNLLPDKPASQLAAVFQPNVSVSSGTHAPIQKTGGDLTFKPVDFS